MTHPHKPYAVDHYLTEHMLREARSHSRPCRSLSIPTVLGFVVADLAVYFSIVLSGVLQ